MHIIFLSILMGLALAIPVGPVTVAMTQRTLKFGYLQGTLLGTGAVTADLLYMFVLLIGMIHILQHVLLLRIVGVIGACMLCWFAYMTLTSAQSISTENTSNQPLSRCYTSGFLIALFSPFNILFWASMSAQLANLTQHSHDGAFFAMIGLFVGLISWVLFLNVCLHMTRHRLSTHTIQRLNQLGGILLLAFALYSLYRIF